MNRMTRDSQVRAKNGQELGVEKEQARNLKAKKCGEVERWLRAFTAFAEDMSSIPSNHVGSS